MTIKPHPFFYPFRDYVINTISQKEIKVNSSKGDEKMPRIVIRYEDLPDTITPIDYMKWRGCGRATADAVFHAKDFPKIKNTGTKLLADKRAVLLYEMGLPKEEIECVLKEIAKEMLRKKE